MGYCSFGFEARASSFATFRRFYSSLARIAHRPTRRRQQEAPRPHTATSHQRDGAPPPWPSPSPPTPPRQPIHVVRVRAHRATNARVRRRSVRARPHTCSTPTHPPISLPPPARPAGRRSRSTRRPTRPCAARRRTAACPTARATAAGAPRSTTAATVRAGSRASRATSRATATASATATTPTAPRRRRAPPSRRGPSVGN